MQITIIMDPLDSIEGANDLRLENSILHGSDGPQGARNTTMLQGALKGEVPLPPATRADSRVMHHVAALMHNSTKYDHGLAAKLLPGSIFLQTAGVIVHATASQTHLFRGEIEIVAISTGHPIILLRHSADASSSDLTADVALPSSTDLSWHFDYKLFRGLAGDSWLVPPSIGPSIRLMRHGIFLSDHAPYADGWDYDSGLERAKMHLASHRIGGWSW